MELHKALRNVIQANGSEIITELRLVNILDDFKAFADIPATKYILRSVIDDGISQKFLSMRAWDNEATQLVNKYISFTGFIPKLAETVFLSLAYGLGWLNSVPNIEVKKTGIQTDICDEDSHMTFLGIPIKGRLQDFVNQLKKKGYRTINKKLISGGIMEGYGGIFLKETTNSYLKGKFSIFSDCIICIRSCPYTQETFSVSVIPRLLSTWMANKDEYDNIKEMLTKKYGSPSSDVNVDRYIDIFETGKGWIFMELSGDPSSNTVCYFMILYNDNIGWEKHEYEEEKAVENDL